MPKLAGLKVAAVMPNTILVVEDDKMTSALMKRCSSSEKLDGISGLWNPKPGFIRVA